MLKELLHDVFNGQLKISKKSEIKDLGVAVVDRKFDPILGGRVRYKGSIWPAFADQEDIFEEKDVVRVLSIVGISLKVEKYC